MSAEEEEQGEEYTAVNVAPTDQKVILIQI